MLRQEGLLQGARNGALAPERLLGLAALLSL
jgi:hypothetical protein